MAQMTDFETILDSRHPAASQDNMPCAFTTRALNTDPKEVLTGDPRTYDAFTCAHFSQLCEVFVGQDVLPAAVIPQDLHTAPVSGSSTHGHSWQMWGNNVCVCWVGVRVYKVDVFTAG
jgi:hypothetical protein